MLGAITNFFTVCKAGSVVRETGREARQTIREAGQESRQTIREAGNESRAVIKIAGQEVGHTIEKGAMAAERVVDKVRRDTKHCLTQMKNDTVTVIQRAGRETRQTSRSVALDVDSTILQGRMNVSKLVYQAGEEMRMSSLSANEDMRETIRQTAYHINQIMKNLQEQSKELFKRGTDSGEILAERVGQIFESNIHQIDASFGSLIDKCHDAIDEIIVNLGDQGHLFVKKMRDEFVIGADQTLEKAAQQAEMIIHCSGEEARFTIAAAGQELRSTLYEIPSIAAKSSRGIGKNFVEGIKESLVGCPLAVSIIRKIEEAQGNTLIDILEFISHQDQKSLSPQHKVQIYKSFIHLCNDLGYSPDEQKRNHTHILIAQHAFNDPALSPYRGWTGTTDYKQQIIDEIPGEKVREALEALKQGNRALVDQLLFNPRIRLLNSHEQKQTEEALESLQNELIERECQLAIQANQLEKQMQTIKVMQHEKDIQETKISEQETIIREQELQIQSLKRAEKEKQRVLPSKPTLKYQRVYD